MNTRKKNKSAHPAIPDMTPSQLLSAGLSTCTSATRRSSRKKLTKDQRIAALENELRIAQEAVLNTRSNDHAAFEEPMDTGGDTELGTDSEETHASAGTKRKARGPSGSAQRLKRSRAIDPFESSSMVSSRATGLVDDWRTRIQSPHDSGSPRSLVLGPQTPNRNGLLDSPTTSAAMTPASSLSSLNSEENPLPTFTLPRSVKGTKVYPGIRDLPAHIRDRFRDEFIRFVMKQVANSKSPWTNPDVDSLQTAYNIVYPTFPARIRHSDAVYHPTTSALGVLRNRLATAAIAAVQTFVSDVFRKKRLDTIERRANYIAQLFPSDQDHPIIWREYVEGDIQNHPEIGGYKTIRRGQFQSDPILGTLKSYYTSSGIMEDPPLEDPGTGYRPLGVLALASAAVERAYKMYTTGDFIPSHQPFNADDWGPATLKFMDYIAHDLKVDQWDSIFRSLDSFCARTAKEEAIRWGAPHGPRERVPLPPSDPPSPVHDG